MKKLFVLLTALALSGCATINRAQGTVNDAIDMVQSVRGTVQQVLDRPAPLANTEQDEVLIRGAYTRFDQGLSIIESLVDRGVIQRNSPNALRIRTGIGLVKTWLRRAYTAQQIGNAATVREALQQARTGLDGLTTNLQQER